MAKTNQSPVAVLAQVVRGYATDDQCAAAVRREEDLVTSLSAAYEAMLTMRAMLAKAGVSLKGGSLQATIEATAITLYPPK